MGSHRQPISLLFPLWAVSRTGRASLTHNRNISLSGRLGHGVPLRRPRLDHLSGLRVPTGEARLSWEDEAPMTWKKRNWDPGLLSVVSQDPGSWWGHPLSL